MEEGDRSGKDSMNMMSGNKDAVHEEVPNKASSYFFTTCSAHLQRREYKETGRLKGKSGRDTT